MKAILNFGGNILVNQTGDANYMTGVVGDRANVPLIVVADHYMTASAAMADYVLPAATAWEKTSYATTWNAGENTIFMGKAVEPLGQALEDFKIVEGIADKAGVKAKFNDGKDGWTSLQYVKEAFDKTTALNSKITWDQWVADGIYSTTNPAASEVIAHQAFLQDPVKSPKNTPSGKFEAYCQAMFEDYSARGYGNVDGAGAPLAGPLQDGSTAARFVYPIPMYIPLYEGLHADGSEPDPLRLKAKGYVNLLNTFHIQYRSHSTHNNNAFLNELYKKDARGQPAFLSPRTRTTRAVWDDGVYEPIWINPATAAEHGIATGNRVLVSNERGRLYASAVVTERARPRVLYLGQGAWHQLDAAGVDVGGCANTVTSARPSRIGCGMTLGNGTLVKVEKA
jgi:anaerobic dimethyl sulfoxide reductase subunit A